MKENLLCATGAKDFQPYEFSAEFKKPAFSLVEMLMALLVASLLLAALAPVMTRRMADSEIKVLSESANYDKDSIITIFTDSSETKEFNIPNDVSRINVTMMGGGGKGGDALYGNKEITTSQNFTVPDDVTKLRVFMIGGGGGGASGGMGNGVSYTSVPAIPSHINTPNVAGSYTFADMEAPDTHIAPALHSYCQKYGTTKKWVVASNPTIEVSPGSKIKSIDGNALLTLSKVSACGGGGGGGGLGGGGGSGGYLVDQALYTTATASNLSIKIGAGGQSGYGTGKGGTGGGTGGAKGGGNGTQPAGGNGTNGSGGNGSGWSGGGGGGTSLSVISSNTILAEIGGGGGGAGHVWRSSDRWATTGLVLGITTGESGSGGGGGGKGSGGGGGSAKLVSYDKVGCTARNGTNGSSNGTGGVSGFVAVNGGAYLEQAGGAGYNGGGGGGGGSYVDNTYASGAICGQTVSNANSNNGSGGGGGGWIQRSYPKDPYAYGGGGGGGAGGVGGTGGGIGGGIGGRFSSTVFNTNNNCSGGSGVSSNGTVLDVNHGKPGAMKIWYSAAAVPNGLKCFFSRPSHGGGGGGAGQVWMGEIKVTPGQTISLNIGNGGAVQNAGAENGNDGNATSIIVGGTTYSVSGGKGGKYESDSTYIANSGGLGGGLKTSNFNSSAVYSDWLKLGESISPLTGGNPGFQGHLKTSSENGKGGNGGSSLNISGYLAGGNGGTSEGNGNDALVSNYGAGGGGGAAGIDGSFGKGGKGANGYIYIEWGGTNGSGGTIGEFVQKVITNIDGNDRKMIINIGKGGSSLSGSSGNGESTTISVKSGGKNVTLTARGGIKGNIGESDSGIHGKEVKYPDNYSDLYKEYVQGNLSIVIGQKGENDYGGMGGYLACLYNSKDAEGNKVCNQIIKSNDGVDITAGPMRPGCGGTSMTAPLYDSICIPHSTSANPNGGSGVYGAGGGGGAVLNSTGGIGGKGGDGFVILEYKSVQ